MLGLGKCNILSFSTDLVQQIKVGWQACGGLYSFRLAVCDLYSATLLGPATDVTRLPRSRPPYQLDVAFVRACVREVAVEESLESQSHAVEKEGCWEEARRQRCPAVSSPGLVSLAVSCSMRCYFVVPL